MIGLGWHLARRQLRGAPDALLGVAVVLATLLLLGAVAVRQGFSERAERAAVREGAAWQGSEPPPWEVAAPFTAGDRSLTLLAMWADRAQPPVLPGLPRNPAPGEVFVSPALAQALRSGADAPLLAARTPGRIAGVLGDELLLGPDELVAVAGFARSTAAPLAEHATRGASSGAPDLPLALVTLLLLVPAAVLLVVCARFDARRRERRLATLRLIGAGPRQVRVLAVVEAMVRSVPAAVVALVAGFLLRPLVASVPLGVRFFAADLRPGALAVAAVLLAAPLLAALATLGALRQVTVTPFAVQRRASRPAPSWRRCLPLLAGCALYLLGTGLSRRISEPLLVAFEVAGLGAVLVGLPLAGPVLIRAAARLVLRTGGGSGSALVGLRRLERDPSAGFRTVAGLVLAAFVFGFVASLDLASPVQGPLPGDVTIQLSGRSLEALLPRLETIPGVRAVAPVLYVPSDADAAARSEPEFGLEPVVLSVALVTTCDGLTDVLGVALTAGRCVDGGLLVPEAGDGAERVGQQAGFDGPRPVTGTFLREAGEVSHDAILTLPLDELVGRELNAAQLATDGSRATALAVIEAAAETVPLAGAGPPDVVFSSAPAAATLTRTLRLTLLTSIVLAACSLLVSIGEALVDRRTVIALLHALGMGPRGARRLTAVEVGLPLITAVLPTLFLGVALSYGGGRLLRGEVRLPWSEIGFAVALTAGLAVAGFLALLTLVRATTTPQLLRGDG